MVYNTGETSEELERRYNPEGSILRKAQLRMLDMMKYLDKVCRDLGIDYMIEGGNILGAIRHGGFIPWDDDFDILVKKSDYGKLCRFLKENPHPQYVLQDKKSDRHYLNFWSVLRDTKSEYLVDSKSHKMRKFRGLQIDIFPIENKNIGLLTKISKNLSWKIIQYMDNGKTSQAHILYHLSRYMIFPAMRMVSGIFGNERKWGYAYGLLWTTEYDEADLFPVSEIPFEGVDLKAPNNPMEYCTKMYGNFMDLPPVDKRNEHRAKYKIWD